VELAKKHELYRQDFCGCEFSRAEAEERRNKKEKREEKEERKEIK
jgi:predicted adenine nucleotide alpha hydrolase (AANH) superfamily ATPase